MSKHETSQAWNEQARVDHIQDQDRIIRQRNEQIREQVKIIKSLRRELEEAERSPSVDFEVLWWNTETEREKQEARAERAEKRAEKAGRERDEARSRLAEATKEIREQGATIAELAAESHPLTPEDITDGMVERGAERLREVIDSGFSPRASWAVRRALAAAVLPIMAAEVQASKAEAILMDGFDMAVADRLADAGYTEYAEDEDGGVTWVSAPLGEVLHIVRISATEYETGDRA